MPLTKEYIAAQSFINHPLFAKEYGDLSFQEMVEKFYTNILGSEGDTAGIEYWVDRLDAGEAADVILSEFLNATLTYDFSADPAALARQNILKNKVEVGLEYAESLGELSNMPKGVDLGSVNIANNPAYQQSAASITQLTAANNNLTGTAGNDTFVARIINGTQTLTSTDMIDGSRGNDTLKAQLNKSITLYGTFIQNIQNVEITAVADAELSEAPVSALKVYLMDFADLKTLASNSSQAKLAFLNVRDQVALNIVGNHIAALDPNNKTGSVILGYANNAANPSLTDQNINLKGATAKNITVQVMNSAGVNQVSELKTLNLNAEGENVINRVGTYGQATEVTQSQTETVNVTGSGSLTWQVLDGAVKTFDASKATGAMTLNHIIATDLSNLKTGSGDDKVVVDLATVTDLSITGGAGADTFAFTGTGTGTGIGTGTITITITDFKTAENDVIDLRAISGVLSIESVNQELSEGNLLIKFDDSTITLVGVDSELTVDSFLFTA